MAIKTSSTLLLAVAAALVALCAPAQAAHKSCLDGTAPAAWKRPGGYCDIASDNRGALRISQGGGGSSGLIWRNTAAGPGYFIGTVNGVDMYHVPQVNPNPFYSGPMDVGYPH